MRYEIWSNEAGRSKSFRDLHPGYSQFMDGYIAEVPMFKSWEADLESLASHVMVNPHLVLDRLYEKFNQDDRPNGSVAHSLSVGDVVVLLPGTSEKSAYSVDSFGFTKLDGFNPILTDLAVESVESIVDSVPCPIDPELQEALKSIEKVTVDPAEDLDILLHSDKFKEKVGSEPETRNSLVYAISERAKKLSDEKIDYLRRSVASPEAHTDNAIWNETRHRSRGDMIEEVLNEEFLTDQDKEFEDEDETRELIEIRNLVKSLVKAAELYEPNEPSPIDQALVVLKKLKALVS